MVHAAGTQMVRVAEAAAYLSCCVKLCLTQLYPLPGEGDWQAACNTTTREEKDKSAQALI